MIRDLMLGSERFKEFARSPEGIPSNILADRLKRLQAQGIVALRPASDGTKHPAYQLTRKGEALRPMMEAMRSWGLAWVEGTNAQLG